MDAVNAKCYSGKGKKKKAGLNDVNIHVHE